MKILKPYLAESLKLLDWWIAFDLEEALDGDRLV
jgi:hypothetical protein